jgi:hypothetical protein
MAKKKSNTVITSEVIDDAVTRFLAKGGTIKRVETKQVDERHIDWITSDYLNKIRDEKKITAEDAKVDLNDYSSAVD